MCVVVWWRETETETARQRQRDRETETARQGNREAETERATARQPNRERDMPTHTLVAVNLIHLLFFVQARMVGRDATSSAAEERRKILLQVTELEGMKTVVQNSKVSSPFSPSSSLFS